MKKIDIISGIAFLSGIVLIAVSASNIMNVLLVPVVIFSSYFTGRITGKKEAWERFLIMAKEAMEEELGNRNRKASKFQTKIEELKRKEHPNEI